MSKKRAQSSMPLLPILPDEFQRGPEAGPEVRNPPLNPAEMTPSPAQAARMKQQVEEDRKQREMDKAYEESKRQSMKRGYASGGSVGSASKRADGCAQRGKTKGRII